MCIHIYIYIHMSFYLSLSIYIYISLSVYIYIYIYIYNIRSSRARRAVCLPADAQMTRSSGESAYQGTPHTASSETWDAGCWFAAPKAPSPRARMIDAGQEDKHYFKNTMADLEKWKEIEKARLPNYLISLSLSLCTYIYIYICMCVYVCVYIYIYICYTQCVSFSFVILLCRFFFIYFVMRVIFLVISYVFLFCLNCINSDILWFILHFYELVIWGSSWDGEVRFHWLQTCPGVSIGCVATGEISERRSICNVCFFVHVLFIAFLPPFQQPTFQKFTNT